MRTADFDYHLPEELIASRPLENRAASRMMVIDRKTGTIEHKMFADFPQYMREDDMIVLNDTKVIPARFHSNDGKIEMVLTDKLSATEWSCLVRPGKKMKVGRTVEVADATGTVVAIQENGNRIISWDKELDIDEVGHLALPHYMNREDDKADRDRYQTVYAREEGAIAAPTAGLHFTPEMLAKLPHTFLTLHVGVGTFRPVKAEYIKDHDMHSERYHLSAQSAEKINQAGRVISTGTTCTRVLESLGKVNPTLSEATGETDIFISPPYDFQVVDCLLTNFHLPQSTLIMLVSAFADRDLILKAYNEAVAHKYRFFSYGDCMLIL
ncbi:tRNA preQ1(34) S-adenosylmethionine ribosyltransferase-isomerase QueA [Persicirhabdus sediminis]|uniref:tRNA preQ1(34) S-adenosylmethionine ribosyltransferase-isomerase QueA n=1 Tax=Persicirhabdus sediminis TaxID=454144 RepID=UPI0031BA9F25